MLLDHVAVGLILRGKTHVGIGLLVEGRFVRLGRIEVLALVGVAGAEAARLGVGHPVALHGAFVPGKLSRVGDSLVRAGRDEDVAAGLAEPLEDPGDFVGPEVLLLPGTAQEDRVHDLVGLEVVDVTLVALEERWVEVDHVRPREAHPRGVFVGDLTLARDLHRELTHLLGRPPDDVAHLGQRLVAPGRVAGDRVGVERLEHAACDRLDRPALGAGAFPRALGETVQVAADLPGPRVDALPPGGEPALVKRGVDKLLDVFLGEGPPLEDALRVPVGHDGEVVPLDPVAAPSGLDQDGRAAAHGVEGGLPVLGELADDVLREPALVADVVGLL